MLPSFRRHLILHLRIDFAFEKCQFNFVTKAEKLQAIHAVVISVMMFLLKKQQELQVLCL